MDEARVAGPVPAFVAVKVTSVFAPTMVSVKEFAAIVSTAIAASN